MCRARLGCVLTAVSIVVLADASTASAQDVLLPNVVVMGDMLLYRENLRDWPADDVAAPRGHLGIHPTYQSRPWEGGVMPIAFEPDVSAERQAIFWAGCAEWTAFTNVRCIPRAPSPDSAYYVRVTTTEGGCTANVGHMVGEFMAFGWIYLSSDRCRERGTLLHEIGHAFGLLHEHQRLDRDDYVTVDESAISGGPAQWERPGSMWPVGEYDFESIRHYSPWGRCEERMLSGHHAQVAVRRASEGT